METFGRRLNSMGMSMRGNAPVYHLPPPSPARLAYLMDNVLPFFASGPDTLTPHGFFAFNFTRSVIIGFLKTHSLRRSILVQRQEKLGERLPRKCRKAVVVTTASDFLANIPE